MSEDFNMYQERQLYQDMKTRYYSQTDSLKALLFYYSGKFFNTHRVYMRETVPVCFVDLRPRRNNGSQGSTKHTVSQGSQSINILLRPCKVHYAHIFCQQQRQLLVPDCWNFN